MRAKRKINTGLPNFPLSPAAERALETSPSFPPPHDSTVYCFKAGLLFVHSTTNSPYLLCSVTKMYFHLKNTKCSNKTAKVIK